MAAAHATADWRKPPALLGLSSTVLGLSSTVPCPAIYVFHAEAEPKIGRAHV